MTTKNLHFNSLLYSFNLKVLIKVSMYYQSHNPTKISSILANQKPSFQLLKTFEMRLSNHNKLM